MRQETKTFTYYKFDELDEVTQQKAIEKLFDINVDHEWWDGVSMDLENIHCKLIGFDTDRGNYCELSLDYETSVIEAILKNHGESCETYRIAKEYESKILDSDGNIDEDVAKEFKQELQEEYLAILRREYEYLTSEEAIRETIEANEYEFNEKGELA